MQIDPALFDPSLADPESVALNVQLERLSTKLPNPIEVGIEPLREARLKGRGLFGPIVRSPNGIDRYIPGPAGSLKLRVFSPGDVDGVFLHFHGGGWAMGSADYQDGRLEQVANAAGVAAVSVDYRLAPEHPYPAPADDAEAAAQWIVENAASEFGTDRIVVGGNDRSVRIEKYRTDRNIVVFDRPCSFDECQFHGFGLIHYSGASLYTSSSYGGIA